MDNVDFPLPRMSPITGRYTRNEPISGVPVMALR